ncbi:hypothetical protein [Flammeovirga sp. SJP92]|uniref:hypothetical protein n=1 Tax=Flammeovirga sp. SJP92 TaxID=1775430 RepID=UPI0007892E21|nr:hypothetical protein [Flammeovirga sp. SJP92]KXX69333.1 hypothetical protein AVL50_19770 [Flammeovirga sp. SJP92]
MMKLFNRKKININSISIPDFGWTLVEDQKGIKQWVNPEQTIALSLNFFDFEPDLPTINQIDELRSFYRNQIVSYNGGLIEVNNIQLKEYKAVKTIFKLPQEPTGMTYIASFTIPFEKYSYVVKIQAPEVGVTGMRDSVIATKLMNENQISIGENGYEGWFKDPYDLSFNQGTMMNKSEEKQYDIEFPEHPLSQARKILDIIASEISFSAELEKIKKFEK